MPNPNPNPNPSPSPNPNPSPSPSPTQVNTLLKAASIRGHVEVVEALLESCFVAVDCTALSVGAPAAWPRLAKSRGWAGESALLGCCYELGSPVLTFDEEERPLAPLTRERLDAVAELLLAHGGAPPRSNLSRPNLEPARTCAWADPCCSADGARQPTRCTWEARCR